MKLIYIYGIPAVGKLTVAEKLSGITGIPIFHNHLSRDIVKDIYGSDLMKNYELVDSIREDVLKYCAKNNTDLIFTYVYGGSEDDVKVHRFKKCIEDNGGDVCFVELIADKEDLLNRVGDESRKRFKKLTDKEIMAELTQDMSKFTIPYVDALKINTSELKSDESARLIANELDLT